MRRLGIKGLGIEDWGLRWRLRWRLGRYRMEGDSHEREDVWRCTGPTSNAQRPTDR